MIRVHINAEEMRMRISFRERLPIILRFMAVPHQMDGPWGFLVPVTRISFLFPVATNILDSA